MNEDRRKTAQKYLEGICNESIVLPYVGENVLPVWHIFAIRTRQRDELASYLRERGIQTGIHYPIPIHKQEAYADRKLSDNELPVCEEISATELSLPMYYGMKEETEYVIKALNEWNGRK